MSFQRVQIALDEGGALEKIEGEIAADTELGEDGEFRATAFGLFRQVENAEELPSKSPTVGLNWARAIFIRTED